MYVYLILGLGVGLLFVYVGLIIGLGVGLIIVYVYLILGLGVGFIFVYVYLILAASLPVHACLCLPAFELCLLGTCFPACSLCVLPAHPAFFMARVPTCRRFCFPQLPCTRLPACCLLACRLIACLLACTLVCCLQVCQTWLLVWLAVLQAHSLQALSDGFGLLTLSSPVLKQLDLKQRWCTSHIHFYEAKASQKQIR